ncbi:MAG: carboxypeptidase M32 [Chlamydiia bacterium]|nr:carboxypeptidase M32 [Chlamydiia bacterium]
MPTKPPPAYQQLVELSTKIHTYGSMLSLLHWDQETYMPSGAISSRSQQIAQLSSLIHEEKTSRKFKICLEKLISLSSGKPKVKGLSKPQCVSLGEWRRDFLKATKLPTAFVKHFSQVTSEASQIWATAKSTNNFKLFAPFLEKIVSLNRKKADILGFGDHPYDALLEAYEPCMTTARVGIIFENLKKELTTLLKKISKAPLIDDAFLHHEVPHEQQLSLSKLTLSKLPVDMAYTRLDLSSHPFSTALHPHDSRITTRIVPKAFMSNIFSILHETGHSLYEMGLPAQHWGTPLGEYISLSIHESQSRWWETLIGRSLPFWTFFYPLLQKEYTPLKKISLRQFYRAINKVESSFIRVEADEVTYCLHVILRFEIEKLLISGQLQVADLPEAWNNKMKELFGISPPNDTMGCLQDIHWSLGDFGYFPTYALGNLFSAQFFHTFSKDHPDWETRVAKGDLAFVRDWLKNKIHRWGRLYTSESLVKKATGKSLNEESYCSYLKNKYAAIYKL